MSFAVRYSAAARADLKRFYAHLLDQCRYAEDLDRAEQALGAVIQAIDSLGQAPFIYRKAAASPFLRERVIPFGSNGYVALFEIDNEQTVTVLAVRHQREDDYH